MTRRGFLATVAGAAIATLGAPPASFARAPPGTVYGRRHKLHYSSICRHPLYDRPCRLGDFRFPVPRGPIPLVYGGRIGQFGPNPFWRGLE